MRHEDKIPWTDDQVETARRLLFDDHLSYGEAAKEATKIFGFNVSKNAMCGKGTRMGVPRRREGLKAPAGVAATDARFESTHSRRVLGQFWDAIAADDGVSSKTLRNWYARQCDYRGIVPASPKGHSAEACEVKPKAGVAKRSGPSNFTFRKESPIEPTPVSLVDECEGVPVLDLRRGCCEWLVNNSFPWKACGKRKYSRVYCDFHHRIAYGRPPRAEAA